MLSDLIGEIYASATQPGQMVNVLERVGRHFDADSAFMFTSHSETEPEAILLGHNICPDAIGQFVSHWHQEDAWAHAAARRGMMRRNVVVVGEELVPGKELCGTSYYNDFARPAGMHHMLGSVLFDGSEARGGVPFTNLCWYRKAGREGFGKKEKRTLAALLPHLQGGLALQYQLQRASLDNLCSRHMASVLPAASLLLDEQLRIVGRHGATERLLGGSVPLVGIRGHQVRSVGARSSPTIQEGVATCRRTRQPVGMVVQRTDGSLVRATVAPLPAEAMTLVGPMDRQCCLLIIELPPDNPAELIRRASSLFRLTAAESDVALGLLKGKTIQQIATQRTIALSTARTQLRGVLEKSGFQRQVDLVRALSRLGG